MNESYEVGELVDITIKGARVTNTYTTGRGRPEAPEDTGTVLVFRMDGARYDKSHTVNMGDSGVTVERTAPAEWPPQPGDLWQELDGALWFAQGLGGSQMALVPATVRDGQVDAALPDYALETFGPLTLVRREKPKTVFCADSECGHHKQLHHGNKCIGGNATEDPCRCSHFRAECTS